MRKAHRPRGRFFLLMDSGAVLVVPASTLMAPPTDPAVTQLIEGLFGHKSGADKKNTALTLGQNSIQATDPLRESRTAVEPLGAMPYCGDMRGIWILVVCASAMNCGLAAQEAPPPAAPPKAKSTTIIGCLAGPDADDLYTLTSMQHRTGVEVVGSDELKKSAGAKVKLTGSWEALPGSDAKKSDATRRFKATEVDVLEEKCQAPAAVTPPSKKKQQQEQQKAQAQQQQK